MGYRSYYSKIVTDITGASGESIIDVSDSCTSILDTGKERLLALRNWQLQFTVSGEAHSGEVTIGLKSPGADDYTTLTTAIDLASANKLLSFSAIVDELKIVHANFDGSSYSIYCIAS